MPDTLTAPGMRYYVKPVPQRVHPLVRRFFELQNYQQCPDKLLCERAGLGHDTLRDWRTRYNPSLQNLDAALRVLGYKLTIVPAHDDDPQTQPQ